MRDNRKHILLVEDERLVAIAERRTLEASEFGVTLVSEGEAAVTVATTDTTVDLVLMDIDLGQGIDGTEAARRVLALREVPIVFLTGHAEQEMVERVKNITRYGYVLKNAGAFVLLEAIAMAFELFETRMEMKRTIERYRWIARSTSDGVAVFEGRKVTYISPSYVRMLGYDPEETTGYTLDELFERLHPDDRDRILETIEHAHRDRKTEFQYWYRMLRKDGSYIWVEDRVRVEYDDAGVAVRSFVSGRDITDTHASERRGRRCDDADEAEQDRPEQELPAPGRPAAAG